MTRILLTVMFVFLPGVSLAAESSLQGAPIDAESPTMRSSVIPGSATASELQPAGPSLQAADASSGGLEQSPTQPNLQSTGTSDQVLAVIGSDGQNSSKLADSDDESISLWWLALAPLGLVAAIWHQKRQHSLVKKPTPGH